MELTIRSPYCLHVCVCVEVSFVMCVSVCGGVLCHVCVCVCVCTYVCLGECVYTCMWKYGVSVVWCGVLCCVVLCCGVVWCDVAQGEYPSQCQLSPSLPSFPSQRTHTSGCQS